MFVRVSFGGFIHYSIHCIFIGSAAPVGYVTASSVPDWHLPGGPFVCWSMTSASYSVLFAGSQSKWNRSTYQEMLVYPGARYNWKNCVFCLIPFCFEVDIVFTSFKSNTVKFCNWHCNCINQRAKHPSAWHPFQHSGPAQSPCVYNLILSRCVCQMWFYKSQILQSVD